jgi:hypothetical protein
MISADEATATERASASRLLLVIPLLAAIFLLHGVQCGGEDHGTEHTLMALAAPHGGGMVHAAGPVGASDLGAPVHAAAGLTAGGPAAGDVAGDVVAGGVAGGPAAGDVVAGGVAGGPAAGGPAAGDPAAGGPAAGDVMAGDVVAARAGSVAGEPRLGAPTGSSPPPVSPAGVCLVLLTAGLVLFVVALALRRRPGLDSDPGARPGAGPPVPDAGAPSLAQLCLLRI